MDHKGKDLSIFEESQDQFEDETSKNNSNREKTGNRIRSNKKREKQKFKNREYKGKDQMM